MTSTLMQSKDCWYVPLRVLQGEGKQTLSNLQPADTQLSDIDTPIEPGGAFTVLLKSFYVYDSYEGDETGNDLLLQSKICYQNEPEIEVVNFFGTDITPGTFQGNLEFQHMFYQQDVMAGDVIALSLELTEVDRGIGRDSRLIESYRAVHQNFGAVFAKVIPFAGKAVTVVKLLLNLQDAMAQNKQLLQVSLRLRSQSPEAGEVPLRCGVYVFFTKPVQGIQYTLDANFQLQRTAKDQSAVPIRDDYVVLSIMPGLVETDVSAESLLHNQQLATVLNYINREEEDTERRQAYLGYVQDLVKDAMTLKALKLYHQLKGDQLAEKTLSEAQQQRLSALKGQLAQYLKTTEQD